MEGGLPLLPMAGMEVRLEILRLGAEEVEPKVRLLSSFTSSRLVLPSRSLTLACMDSSTSIPCSPDPPVLSFRTLVPFALWVLRKDFSFCAVLVDVGQPPLFSPRKLPATMLSRFMVLVLVLVLLE